MESEFEVKLFDNINKVKALNLRCKDLPNLQGKEKLLRKITTELSFLEKLSMAPFVKPEKVMSSNLSHLSAMVQCCHESKGTVKVFKSFSFSSPGSCKDSGVIVDVVSDYGAKWIKVVARNPVALLQLSKGGGRYGQKSITEHVEKLVECSHQHEYMFRPPKVVVWFASLYMKELEDLFEGMDVEVVFRKEDFNLNTHESEEQTSNHSPSDKGIPEQNEPESVVESGFSHNSECLGHYSLNDSDLTLCSIPEQAVLNLDVSTMIAQVSNLTNGSANASLTSEVLCNQAKSELISPVRDKLMKLFKNGQLVCCNTAYTDFKKIVACIGGAEEKKRASDFLKQVNVVPDNPSEQAERLKVMGYIRKRSKIIFGTGDSLKAITVTANNRFLRAAILQGAKFNAVFHESRALSESKEVLS